MAILLLAEHDNATLSDQTAKTLTAATQIGGDVTILVAGSGAKPLPMRQPSFPASPRSCWPTTHPTPTSLQSRWQR